MEKEIIVSPQDVRNLATDIVKFMYGNAVEDYFCDEEEAIDNIVYGIEYEPENIIDDLKEFANSEKYIDRVKATRASGKEEQKPVLFVIKDASGRQLSTPNPNDSELWDRVEAMEARGKRGLKVVAYVAESVEPVNEELTTEQESTLEAARDMIDELEDLLRSSKIKLSFIKDQFRKVGIHSADIDPYFTNYLDSFIDDENDMSCAELRNRIEEFIEENDSEEIEESVNNDVTIVNEYYSIDLGNFYSDELTKEEVIEKAKEAVNSTDVEYIYITHTTVYSDGTKNYRDVVDASRMELDEPWNVLLDRLDIFDKTNAEDVQQNLAEEENLTEATIYISKAEMAKLDKEVEEAGKEVAKYNIPMKAQRNSAGQTESVPDFDVVPENQREAAKAAYDRYQKALAARPSRSQNIIKYTDDMNEGVEETVSDVENNLEESLDSARQKAIEMKEHSDADVILYGYRYKNDKAVDLEPEELSDEQYRKRINSIVTSFNDYDKKRYAQESDFLFYALFNNSMKESMFGKLYTLIVKCNDGPEVVIRTMAEDDETAIKYAKSMYASSNTVYADDRQNDWNVEIRNAVSENLCEDLTDEEFEAEIEKLDAQAIKFEEQSQKAFEDGNDEGGYYYKEVADELRRTIDMMLASRPKKIEESGTVGGKDIAKETFLKELANLDYDVGHTYDPDDFSYFQRCCKDDGWDVTEEDFDKYFEYLDEVRADKHQDDANIYECAECGHHFNSSELTEALGIANLQMFLDDIEVDTSFVSTTGEVLIKCKSEDELNRARRVLHKNRIPVEFEKGMTIYVDADRIYPTGDERLDEDINSGNISTVCPNCGKKNKVAVNFPAFNKPFEDKEYICDECGSENIVRDEHKYAEDGTILEDASEEVETEECAWCGHFFKPSELKDTDFGKICPLCDEETSVQVALDDLDDDMSEGFQDDWNDKVMKSALAHKDDTSDKKYNIGSNKVVDVNSPEYSRLEELAKMLEEKSPNGFRYRVEKTYEDFGAGMQWYTIICYNRKGDSWQTMNTKQWLDLANEDKTVEETYNDMIAGDFWQDKIRDAKDIAEMEDALRYFDSLED